MELPGLQIRFVGDEINVADFFGDRAYLRRLIKCETLGARAENVCSARHYVGETEITKRRGVCPANRSARIRHYDNDIANAAPARCRYFAADRHSRRSRNERRSSDKSTFDSIRRAAAGFRDWLTDDAGYGKRTVSALARSAARDDRLFD